MVEALNTHGVDSFVGRIASTVQGVTDLLLFTLLQFILVQWALKTPVMLLLVV